MHAHAAALEIVAIVHTPETFRWYEPVEIPHQDGTVAATPLVDGRAVATSIATTLLTSRAVGRHDHKSAAVCHVGAAAQRVAAR